MNPKHIIKNLITNLHQAGEDFMNTICHQAGDDFKIVNCQQLADDLEMLVS